MALTLRDTSMFSGLRCRDLPLNESVGSLCDYAKTSDSLEHLCLSGVLPDAARLSGTGARSSLRLLVEALAAGAATRLPLTELDLSHNELRDGGVLAVAALVAALPHASMVKVAPWQCPSSAPVPLQGAPCGSG